MNSATNIFKLLNRTCRICPTFINHRISQFSKMSTNASISQVQRDKDSFQDLLPGIIDSVIISPTCNNVPEVPCWIKKILEYNLAGGKQARGLATVFAYETLEKPDNITEESLRQCRIIGWCVEMLQAYLMVMDDIMDGSTSRRGVPCWYRLPHVGMGAINDAILIYSSMMHVLNSHFKHLPQYADILDLFNQTLLCTSMGQHLDYTMAHREKTDYSLFTIERYETIAKYKGSYYTFKLPISLGMLLSNITDKDSHTTADDICFMIGYLFQMQDDYIDCFGVESVTGKNGTDIQEGKCTWLAATALSRFNETQLNVFKACYGSAESAHINRIKRLYEEISIPELYRQKEVEIYTSVVAMAQSLPAESTLTPDLFLKLLDVIYERKK